MKKIYFLLAALIIGNASFASGWVETFNGNINVFAVDDGTAQTPPDDAWYFTGITTINFLGMKSVQSAWKTGSNWNFGNDLKPAAASFAYFNGSLVLSNATSNEFSLVSPRFRPASGVSTLYYEIQEIKVWPDDNPKTGEQIFFEVGIQDANGEWVWTSSSANVLAGLTDYNSATTPITVFQADLSGYIGKDIKIRFRGLTDQGAFAAIFTKVALIDNSTVNFAASTLNDIPALIPEKHISRIVKATLTNQGRALSAGEVSAKVASIPAEYEATASVPALGTFESKDITFTVPFVPKSFKEYSLQYHFTAPGISNSVTSAPFTVTPNTFASDNGYLSAYAGSYMPVGKKFTLTETDYIESVSVGWAKYTSEPLSYDFKMIIYKVTGATAESVFESETFTRPTMAQTPPNERTATFTDYVFPTPVALAAGDYIFAVSPTNEIHVGVDYTNLSPGYKVNPETNDVTIDVYNNYLIRVNTGSDIALVPASNFATADVNAPIKVTFKDPDGIRGINALGIQILDSQGKNTGKVFSITYDAGVLNIRHTTLDFNTLYTVVIPKGCIIGYGKPISWSFTTQGTINPKTYSPANFGSNVALDAPISIQFDRAIPVHSTKAGITIVKNDASQEAVADVSATVDDFTLKIAHADFVNGTQYKVTVPASAIDQYTGQDISWTFTTLPPFGISSYYPENGATDVDLTTAIRVVFNQTIPEGSSLEGITVGGKSVTASITSSWNLTNNQVSLNTSELALKEGTEYEVFIPAGAIAGWNEDIIWSFTTYLQLAVTAYSPKANALNVARDAEISVQFNKTVFRPMWGTPPAITIKAGETEVAGVSGRTEGNKLIISHADFDYKTEYTVTVPSGNINTYNENITWKFTTESDVLDIIEYTPDRDATGVSVRNTVAVSFNREITLGNTGGITINGEAPTGVSLSSSIDGINNQLKINHANFQQDTEYTVVVPAGAVVGYSKEITWKFKTVEPLVPTVSPPNGKTEVALDEPLIISFNRKPMLPMRPMGFITITGENGTEVEVIRRTWNAAGNVLTIEHAPFDLLVTYTVTVPAGLIIDASDYSRSIVWSFTTTGGSAIKEVSNLAKVYPTLTKGNLTINAEPGTKVKIVNIAGQIVAVHQLTGSMLNLNLAYSNGMYVVVLENNDKVSTHKIILQK